MSSLWFALYLTCLFFKGTGQTTNTRSSVHVPPQSRFKSARVGERVTLECFNDVDKAVIFSWYKHTLGKRLKRISMSFVSYNNGTLLSEFKNNPRFKLATENGAYHLIISDLKISDSAIYYCAGSAGDDLEFAEGIRVNVKGSELDHQSETIQPGGSKSVNCTLYTGTSDGDDNIYWFKTSDEDHPGMIYTHGGSNNQSERKQAQTCVYNLPITSLDSPPAGIYYCAMASCGHIVSGDKAMEGGADCLMSMYLLSGGLAFTTILVVVLAYKTYSMNKNNGCRFTEQDCKGRSSDASVPNEQGLQDADNLHYAAIMMNTARRSTTQREDKRNECVYSSVRQ